MVCLLDPHREWDIEEPKDRDGRPWGVDGLEDHLLVLLILYRCHITQDFLACLYQCCPSQKDSSCLPQHL
jgi:hypothetical protein